MLSPKKSQQVQRVLILGGLFLLLYYLLVFRPLGQRAEDLDQPLIRSREKLVSFNLESGALEGLETRQIEASLERVRTRLEMLSSAVSNVTARIELDQFARARMKEPFQLIDFQNERQLRIEQLETLAAQNQVTLVKAVTAGFPEFVAEQRQPGLLWAQLSVAHQLVATAVNCKVGTVRSLQILPPQPHPQSTNETVAVVLDEIPVRIELVGRMPAVTRFLLSLPLRAEEIKTLGLPPESPAKPALFLDRILLRKNSAEVPDEVSLDLRVSGFIVRGS